MCVCVCVSFGGLWRRWPRGGARRLRCLNRTHEARILGVGLLRMHLRCSASAERSRRVFLILTVSEAIAALREASMTCRPWSSLVSGSSSHHWLACVHEARPSGRFCVLSPNQPTRCTKPSMGTCICDTFTDTQKTNRTVAIFFHIGPTRAVGRSCLRAPRRRTLC